MLTPWSAAKVEAFDHLQALWRLDRALDAERLATSGGLQWKQVQGREYLIHHYIDPTAGKRRFDSKGVRSPETEAWASAFKTRREGCGAEGGRIAEQTRVQSAIAKAVRLGRAPAIVGETLRAVALSPLAGSVTLSGSLAMLAYEAQARANVDAAALPPPYGRPDLDLLLDEDVSLEAVAAVLRQVDTGFASAGFGGHRFSNGEAERRLLHPRRPAARRRGILRGRRGSVHQARDRITGGGLDHRPRRGDRADARPADAELPRPEAPALRARPPARRRRTRVRRAPGDGSRILGGFHGRTNRGGRGRSWFRRSDARLKILIPRLNLSTWLDSTIGDLCFARFRTIITADQEWRRR